MTSVVTRSAAWRRDLSRVLLADDDRLSAELSVTALEADGHEVVLVADGPRAYARALAEPFDVLILDVQMAGMSGGAVCRELRRAGIERPILAAGALTLADEVARALAAGFNEHLIKPLAAETLRQAVRRHSHSGGR